MIHRRSIRRTTAAGLLFVAAAIGACAGDDTPDPATATSAPTSTTSTTTGPLEALFGEPGLLRPELLDGDWQVTDPPVIDPELCDEPIRSRIGAVDSDRTSLLLQTDENATGVEHELVRYESAEAATAAVERLRTLPERCPQSTRQDDDGPVDLRLEPAAVPGHPATAAIELWVEWAHGSGQVVRLTATRYGSTVSFLDVDAVQGGIPTDQHVAEILAAVPVD